MTLDKLVERIKELDELDSFGETTPDNGLELWTIVPLCGKALKMAVEALEFYGKEVKKKVCGEMITNEDWNWYCDQGKIAQQALKEISKLLEGHEEN